MNTAVINVKVERSFKSQVQKLANDMGLSLSALIHILLKHALTTKTITLSTREEPNEFFIQALKESQEDIKAGRVSPTFDNAEDAIKWLRNPKKKYAHQLQ